MTVLEPTTKTKSGLSSTKIMMYLSIAYAANTGGTGTLTGTGSIILFKGIVADISQENPINFGSWMFYSVPVMVVNMVLDSHACYNV